MQHKTLREIAKFASGLILGDFLFGLWLYTSGLLPMKFWGMNFTDGTVAGWMLFDALLFIYLVHYGWYTAHRARTSTEKKFHRVAGVVFTLVALLHLSRLLFGWNFVLGSWAVPYWINALGAVITAFLAYAAFSLANREE
ncbi:MAG TPA: hypothetical protein VG694_00895 [Candidatus Paceibacterota bacterium]|jgi:hypothetical protein|nr:hypothetical protein [Candidatus Paceibacterota bacterium]